ncbi:hypothetical protein CCH79_00011117 [Gambusia affinis]|uniref:Neurotransmitter-gated ion-channel ligand-binding domain-containing protein n=1 Tax=Gambusia affinis TaxID=33528 RepID=A0A315URZ1_GAMAF|nr:hypothetical protein CCH79_00011117 [Gambusia affinis]
MAKLLRAVRNPLAFLLLLSPDRQSRSRSLGAISHRAAAPIATKNRCRVSVVKPCHGEFLVFVVIDKCLRFDKSVWALMKSILPKDRDEGRWSQNVKPTVIDVDIFVNSIGPVSSINMKSFNLPWQPFRRLSGPSTSFEVQLLLRAAVFKVPAHRAALHDVSRHITELRRDLDSAKEHDMVSQRTAQIQYALCPHISLHNHHCRGDVHSAPLTVQNLVQGNELHEYQIDIIFAQTWIDSRLRYNSTMKILTLNSNMVGLIWVPDTIFRNSKTADSHWITMPNQLLRIWNDGKILYTLRLTINAECQLQLHNFPMDEHSCPLVFSSYGYSQDEMIYKWRKNSVEAADQKSWRLYQFDFMGLRNTTGVIKTMAGKQQHAFLLGRHISGHNTGHGSRFLLGNTSDLHDQNDTSGHHKRSKPLDERLPCHPTTRNFSVLDVRPPPHTVIALNNAMYWQEFEDACVYECLDGKDCQSFFCCFEECKGGAWRRGRVHIDLLELDAYSRVLFPTSFLLFNIVYWIALRVVELRYCMFGRITGARCQRKLRRITTVLTMTTLSSVARTSLPRVSYVTAMDLFVTVCFLFVFAALMEYATLNYYSYNIQRPSYMEPKRLIYSVYKK